MYKQKSLKDFIDFIKPVLTKSVFYENLLDVHFSGTTAQVSNGSVVAEYPCISKDKFALPGEQFIKAVSACDFRPVFKEHENKVVLNNDRFTATIYKTDYQWLSPDPKKNKKVKIADDILQKLKILYPFISDDASRTWSQSILAKNGYLYVTNNIVAVRIKCEISRTMVFSADLVKALIQYKQPIKRLDISTRHNVVHYKNGARLVASAVAEKWPEIEKMFPKKFKTKPVPEELLKGVDLLKPFALDDTLVIQDKTLKTDYGSFENVDLPDCGFSCANMQMALKFFDRINLKTTPILLKGKNGLQGLMAKNYDA